jgi:hypothetical protein
MRPTILTAYTDTHRPIYEKHFLPSFHESGMSESWDLHVCEIDRPSGKYGTQEFNDYLRELMVKFLEFMAARPGATIIHAGCDIRFYRNVTQDIISGLEKLELLAINDNYGLACCDFFAFKVTDRILDMYQWTIENEGHFPNNEFAFNHYLRQHSVSVGILPVQYWTIGLSNGGKPWSPGMLVNPPPDIALHHGNFTIGADNKIALMDAVLACVRQNASQC